jgi:hypothetical protein
VFSEVIDAEVARDGVEPGGEPRFVLEVGRVLDDADEGVLHHFFRRGLAPQVPQREIEEGPLVLSHEQREGRPIPTLEPDHERFVGRFGP